MVQVIWGKHRALLASRSGACTLEPMLIDIFARRYQSEVLRSTFEERDRRLLLQAFRILTEDLHPTFRNGKKIEASEAFWRSLHDELSRELGLLELSPRWFTTTSKWNGNDTRSTHEHTSENRCKNWYIKQVDSSSDTYIKERLSLVELGFRKFENDLQAVKSTTLSPQIEALLGSGRTGILVPGNRADGERAWQQQKIAMFEGTVEELNTRFQQAGYRLHYHNGFIQASTDDLIQVEVEAPFWSLVSTDPWRNVDHDMKEALDRRDGGGRDPAFYAARALESAIKIVSEKNGWTSGKERGAHGFIDNLSSKSNAYIEKWEAESLKSFFTAVRNPMSHGAGSVAVPELMSHQTEWAIEFCMSWIKNLIRRL